MVTHQAQACLERAVAYVKERKQFGRPIGDNQYLQFKLAEMATSLVSARYTHLHSPFSLLLLLPTKDPAWTYADVLRSRCFAYVLADGVRVPG
jgi:alkylation response protein AidB-like acyl-CoA dehydrogenase